MLQTLESSLKSNFNIFLFFFLFCSNEQNILVRGLEPNTRYEFAIRLHIDTLSSPWSPVVYQNTLPEGNKNVKTLNTSQLSDRINALFLADFHTVFKLALNIISPAPTLPPAHVRVTLIEVDTALVSWKPPDEPAVAVTHYTVLYASRQAWIAGEWQVLHREGEECEERLHPNTAHQKLVEVKLFSQRFRPWMLTGRHSFIILNCIYARTDTKLTGLCRFNRNHHHGSAGEPEAGTHLLGEGFCVQQRGRRSFFWRGGAVNASGPLLRPRPSTVWQLHVLHWSVRTTERLYPTHSQSIKN